MTGIIPAFVPTWITTVEICAALGGLLMAVLAMKKKKLAKKYEEAEFDRIKKEQEQKKEKDGLTP